MVFTIDQTVDLRQPDRIQYGKAVPMYSGDKLTHTWRVKVMDGGSAASTTGIVHVYGYFQCGDGNTVVVAGSVTNGCCSVSFTDAVYAADGEVRALMRISYDADDSYLQTIAACVLTVYDGTVGGIVASRETLPSIDALISSIDAMDERVTAIEEGGVTTTSISQITDLYLQATAPTSATAGSVWLITSEG